MAEKKEPSDAKSTWSLFSRSAGEPEAGTTDSNRNIAIAVIIIGGLGAVASAMRPILRQKYGGSGPTKAQRKAAEAAVIASYSSPSAAGLGTGVESPQVAPLLERLRELQRWHQQRHPLWYGRPTPELVNEMGTVLARRAEQEGEDGSDVSVPSSSAPQEQDEKALR